MKTPAQQDDAFLSDVASTRHQTDDALRLWWLGQSGFLIQFNGRHLLFDPYLSDSLTTKYAHTDKPHTRITQRVVRPERLDCIDVVTSTHNHTDHLDAETLCPLMRANRELTIVVPAANRTFAANRLSVDPDRLTAIDAGESTESAGFKLTAVPAAHESLDLDDTGRHLYLGYVAQFGPWTVYHSGDTVRYEGMIETLRQFPIDVALLPINGRNPTRRVPGNLTGPEAASLAQQIGAATVVPCHFDMFEFNTVTPDEFVAAAGQLGQQHHLLRNGEKLSIMPDTDRQ